MFSNRSHAHVIGVIGIACIIAGWLGFSLSARFQQEYGALASILVAGAGILLLLRSSRAVYIMDKRARAGLCPHCGYDLRASKDRCPECGREIVNRLLKD